METAHYENRKGEKHFRMKLEITKTKNIMGNERKKKFHGKKDVAFQDNEVQKKEARGKKESKKREKNPKKKNKTKSKEQ